MCCSVNIFLLRISNKISIKFRNGFSKPKTKKKKKRNYQKWWNINNANYFNKIYVIEYFTFIGFNE